MARPLNAFQRRLRQIQPRITTHDPIDELLFAASHRELLTPSEHRRRLLSDLQTFPGPLTLPFNAHIFNYVFHDISLSDWCSKNSINYSIIPNPKLHPATLLTLEYTDPFSDFADFEL